MGKHTARCTICVSLYISGRTEAITRPKSPRIASQKIRMLHNSVSRSQFLSIDVCRR